MSHDFPPPNPRFAVGTTYGTRGRIEHPPRIFRPERSRDMGAAATHAVIPLGPGFLKSVQERMRAERQEAKREQLEKYAFPISAGELRSSVTERGSREAADLYSATHDEDIRRIVSGAFSDSEITPEGVQEVLRSDDMLRLQLGEYLRNKLEDNPVFWGHEKSQIALNVMKQTPAGYEAMPSRDYAVQLALAMLDGTFKPEQQDTMEIAKSGLYENGEHRTVAYKLLRYAAPNQEKP